MAYSEISKFYVPRKFPGSVYGASVFTQVCKSYCEEVRTGKCKELWNIISVTEITEIELPDCETLPSPEGGDYLECFIPYNNGRARRDINSTGK